MTLEKYNGEAGMNEAIKIAIKNGYANSFRQQVKSNSEHLLDPLFWQALGKGLGWRDYDRSYNQADQLEVERVYLKHWHRFIDHLASNGDIDSFFNELTK